MKKKYIYIFCWIALFATPTLGQEVGKLFTSNYSYLTYGSSPQNWDATQSKEGFLYFGNTVGIVEYDGANWRSFPSSNQTAVRSISTGEDGIVYYGAQGEFGYLAPDSLGKVTPVSLLPKVDTTHHDFADIWKIIPRKDGVYFHSYKKTFRWDGQQITVWEFDVNRSQLIQVGGELYLFSSKNGIQKKVGEDWINILGADVMKGKVPTIAWKIDHQKILLANRASIVIFDEQEKTLSPFESEAQDYLRKHSVYRSAIYKDNLVIGTLQGGAILIDKKGNILRKFSREEGLQNDKIYNVFIDRDGILWLCLANGITKIELASAYDFWGKDMGIEGQVLAVRRHAGKIYLGTTQGLYISNPSESGGLTRFQLIQGPTSGSRFYFFKEEQLLMGAANGLYHIQGDKAIRISKQPRVYDITPSSKDTNRVWMACQRVVKSMYFSQGKWIEEEPLEKLPNTVSYRAVHQDPQGDLWVATMYNGIKQLKVDEKPTGVQTIQLTAYDSIIDMPTIRDVRIRDIQKETIFSSLKGFYRFNKEKSQFEHDTTFGVPLGNGSKQVYLVAEDKQGVLWLNGLEGDEEEWLGAAHPNGDSYQWRDDWFKRMPTMSIQELYADPEGYIWVGGADGVYRFDPAKHKPESKFQSFVRKMSEITADSTLYWGDQATTTTGQRVDYKLHSLLFQFSSNFYIDEKNTQYSHSLESQGFSPLAFEEEWSIWSSKTEKEFTNLPEGNYLFKVKAKNIYGVESEVGSYAFTVTPPWYRSIWAYTLYLILIAGAIRGVILLNERRLKAENQRLEDQVKLRTAEIEQQKEEILVQAENLQDANTSIQKKNTVLEQQKEEISMQAENMSRINQEMSKQKTQVERALANIEILSNIGQQITSTLDLESVVKTVYENVNTLMHAEAFGIGVVDLTKNCIAFNGFIEKGQVLPEEIDHLDDHSRLSVWCFQHQKEVFINDLRLEMGNYLPDREVNANSEIPLSLLYLPLTFEEDIIGVITVQSFQANAYTHNDLTLLQSLASYIAIAIANSHSYDVIKLKNKHITDSIRYAKTIQHAILPSHSEISAGSTNYFAFYRPKDIVSGDFYWFAHFSAQGEKPSKTFVAVVDCTGHGVPGAFMSMIGNTLLDEVIKLWQIHEPHLILERMDDEVRKALHQEETDNDDGMDVCLCLLERHPELSNVELTFSGAKRPLYIASQATGFIELKGDNRAIGGKILKKRPFTIQKLSLEKGDRVYLTTDGLADQPMENGQKVGSSQVKKWLDDASSKDLASLETLLSQAVNSFIDKGAIQRDDITVLGVEV